MMSVSEYMQKGFSAVELLITLFIASIFLFAGYQLYTQVLKDGADADKTARISNLVYERLRKATAATTESAPAGCAASNESTTNETPIVSGFSSVTLTIVVDCPYSTSGSLSDLFYVSVSASYNDGTGIKVLKHAVYTS
ncbi:MAG TPA: prepilin-type N-terminal cleavage/methylation domain-containing protein [Candidatus Saccharibacteria bacterium]|nr:prepilin-type N-terminal cleavage/methylation domain-containing protein [Candidatus Saccharibacteria bacterium]